MRSTQRRQRGQPAGVDRHDDLVGVDRRRCSVRTPATRPPEISRSRAGGGEQHGHAARLAAARRARRPASPSRRGPSRRRSSARRRSTCPSTRARCAGRGPRAPSGSRRPVAQPLVLERLLGELVQRQPGGEQGPGLLARVLGGEGALEPVAAQCLPVVGERVDVRRPAARPAPAPRRRRPPRSGRRGCRRAGRARCRPRRRAGATGSTGTSSTSFSSGAAGLAEEVAQHGGQQRVRRPGVPAEPVLLDEADRPAEPWSRLEQGHVVADLGQPGGARQSAVPAADHHHA